MQEKVCKGRVNDVDKLRLRILTDELDQRVTDTAGNPVADLEGGLADSASPPLAERPASV